MVYVLVVCILFLRDLGGASNFDAKELYRCMQIMNGQKLDGTDMDVLIRENGRVDISTSMSVTGYGSNEFYIITYKTISE